MSIGMEGDGPNPRVYSKADYDSLAAECERLLRMNKGYEATLTRVDNMWKKRWLEKTGEPAIALIVDDEFKSYFEEIKALKAKVAALESQQAASAGASGYIECRECDECQHAGFNDAADGKAACHSCLWTGDDPEEDICPGCGSHNCMAAACPECGSRYVLVADTKTAALSPAGGGVVMQEGWLNGFPPAGELCEARIPHHTAEGMQMLWSEVEVICHAVIKGVVYSWVKEPGVDGGYYAPLMLSFRRIETDSAKPQANSQEVE